MFIDLINKLKKKYDNIHFEGDDNILSYIRYINDIENSKEMNEEGIAELDNVKKQLKKYISIEELLLMVRNSNNPNDCLISIEYLPNDYYRELILIFKDKIKEVPHTYYSLNVNYNYDNYFKILKKLNNVGISVDIVDKFNFINNNDINIDNIKESNINVISKNDLYSFYNHIMNNYLEKELELLPKKNNKYINLVDITNTKDPEVFLFNYFTLEKSITYTNVKKSIKDLIQS